jgi:hypothetical protein
LKNTRRILKHTERERNEFLEKKKDKISKKILSDGIEVFINENLLRRAGEDEIGEIETWDELIFAFRFNEFHPDIIHYAERFIDIVVDDKRCSVDKKTGEMTFDGKDIRQFRVTEDRELMVDFYDPDLSRYGEAVLNEELFRIELWCILLCLLETHSVIWDNCQNTLSFKTIFWFFGLYPTKDTEIKGYLIDETKPVELMEKLYKPMGLVIKKKYNR